MRRAAHVDRFGPDLDVAYPAATTTTDMPVRIGTVIVTIYVARNIHGKQTAACRSLRPVANAFGVAVGAT